MKKPTLEDLFRITKKHFPLSVYSFKDRIMICDTKFYYAETAMIFFVRYVIESGFASTSRLADFLNVDKETIEKTYKESESLGNRLIRVKTGLLNNALKIRKFEQEAGI